MKSDVELQLDTLKGKSVLYQKKVIKILGYKIFPSGYLSVTLPEGGSISVEKHLVPRFMSELSSPLPDNFTPVNIDNFLDDEKLEKKQFPKLSNQQIKRNEIMNTEKKVTEQATEEKGMTTTQSNNSQLEYQPSEESKTIKQALMDQLKKVGTSSANIPQAKAVCDIANTLVNIQKNEIAMIQLLKKK